jgi:hypothetical protein
VVVSNCGGIGADNDDHRIAIRIAIRAGTRYHGFSRLWEKAFKI